MGKKLTPKQRTPKKAGKGKIPQPRKGGGGARSVPQSAPVPKTAP